MRRLLRHAALTIGVDVPDSRQVGPAEDTDEVVVAHDVELVAAFTPTEHHVVREVAGAIHETGAVQRSGDGAMS